MTESLSYYNGGAGWLSGASSHATMLWLFRCSSPGGGERLLTPGLEVCRVRGVRDEKGNSSCLLPGDSDLRLRQHVFDGVDQKRDPRRDLLALPPVFYRRTQVC